MFEKNHKVGSIQKILTPALIALNAKLCLVICQRFLLLFQSPKNQILALKGLNKGQETL